ncbi:hypothetical protein SPONN_1664 [uncultured Candidatus Thioglobus sp.]|nr:hypothetical protein SPONN_1664 [uncultured Candidatus Thioglobus sp.]
MLVNISEAKTNLSSLINRAYQGEKITIAKHNLPMIDLVVHQSNNQNDVESAFGLFKDKKIDGLEFQTKIRDEW